MESGAVKTRWNACHAAANMFQNPSFPIGSVKTTSTAAIAPYTVTFFATLLSVMTKSKNYKVRINASQALATAQYRACFTDESNQVFASCWRTVLDSYEKASEWTADSTVPPTKLDDVNVIADGGDDVGFLEFRYKAQLAEQLRTTLLHLTKLMNRQDFVTLQSQVQTGASLLMHAFDDALQTASSPKQSSPSFVALSNLLSHLEAFSTTIPLDLIRECRKRVQDVLMHE
jgi:hypothetical protein